MVNLRVTGWQRGLKSISMIEALQKLARLPLSTAKALTETVLAGETITIPIESPERAKDLAAGLRQLGAEATVDGDDAA